MNRLVGLIGACLLLGHGAAATAGSVYFSEPAHAAAQKVSTAADPRGYRIDAARHFYDEYAPPHLQRTPAAADPCSRRRRDHVDQNGHASDIKLVRGPSHAPDVSAAVIEAIRRANLPKPTRLAGNVKFTEIWLVTKDGRFQLDALTEGRTRRNRTLPRPVRRGRDGQALPRRSVISLLAFSYMPAGIAVDVEDLAGHDRRRRSRNTAAPASSCGCAQRPAGVRLAIQALNSTFCVRAVFISVAKNPGAIALHWDAVRRQLDGERASAWRCRPLLAW